MTRAAEPIANWTSWLRDAERSSRPDRLRALAELVLAGHELVLPKDRPTPTSIPPGQPGPALVRAAARQLLDDADSVQADPSRQVWRVLGLTFMWERPQRQLDGDLPEHRSAAESMHAAVASADDPVLAMLAAKALSGLQRDLFELDESRRTAEELVEVCTRARAMTTSALHEALPETTWLPTPSQLAGRFLVAAHMKAAIALRHLRQYDAAIAARKAQVDAAILLDPAEPYRVADALGNLASLQRSVGNVLAAIETLEEQGRGLQRSRDISARVVASRSMAAQARFFRHWDEERRHLLERLRLDLEAAGEPVATSPVELSEAVERIWARELQHTLLSLGNACYELGRNLIDSGAAAALDSARLESRQWLDAASQSWRDIGFNGHIAIRHRRLMLDAMETEAADERHLIGRQMVQDSREWRRPVGQRRAAIHAVDYGAPGDSVVLARLDELDQNAPPIDHAHLAVGRSLWYHRSGDQFLLNGDVTAARDDWESALSIGHEAQQGLQLRPGGRQLLIDPEAFIRTVQVQAQCLMSLAKTDPPGSVLREDPLRKRLQCLPAIAQLFAAAGTLGQRKLAAQTYEPWLVETALMAVEASDADAVDVVAEVARRDLVGLLLRGLADDVEAPAELAEAARRLTAAFSATLSVDESDSPDDDVPLRDLSRSADTLGGAVSRALDVVSGVLGPLGRGLFDPDSVTDATAGALLRRSEPGRAAVLSLWLVDTPKGSRVVRRLALRRGSVTTDTVDAVDVPNWVADVGSTRFSDELFLRSDWLVDCLIPVLLKDELLATSTAGPLHLTIVPTGLLGIPFSALPVDDGTLLVDVAVVSLVQSLQAAAVLAGQRTSGRKSERAPSSSVAVATYDVVRLAHASTELEALLASFPDAVQAQTLKDVRQALEQHSVRGASGLYALALHGQRGVDGWSQTKTLPSGEPLTVGHMLQVYFPRLVVGASCNTDIRSGADGELSGFPLAFQLRGATDVVGTLYDVADATTAEIMSVFYRHVSAGAGPAQALRAAQLEWISVDRDNRLRARDKWAYLVSYGIAND